MLSKLQDIKAPPSRATAAVANAATMASSPWLVERPFLNGGFLLRPDSADSDDPSQEAEEAAILRVELGNMPQRVQELALLNDLLFVSVGMEGKYIRVKVDDHGEAQFYLPESLQRSHSDLVRMMLPLFGKYVYVQRFVHNQYLYERGMCNQALASALQSLLKRYLAFIAQLEALYIREELTLHSMWLYLQKQLATFDTLHMFAKEIDRLKATGGTTLDILYRYYTTRSGDETVQAVIHYLLRETCAPYMAMLQEWIMKGVINDPYHEFLVMENRDVSKNDISTDFNDAYWDERYTLREVSCIPSFLQRSAPRILLTGKYLNAIRECGLTVSPPNARPVESTHNEREIIERVEAVHGWANAQLLDLIVHKSELISHLRSLKQYFLLEQGNWVENFMELAQDELNKKFNEIAEWKLKSKLDIALDGVEDVNKDNLKLALLSHSLSTQLSLIHAPPPEDNKTMLNSTVFAKEKDSKLTGFGCFTLDYKAQWPVSLVLSRKALTQYQLLFRLLFYCKRVRNGLDNAWLWHQSMKELPHVRALLAHTFLLRQRMLHVVTTLERYFLLDVVEPNWRLLEKRVREAATVEQILSFHNDCINSSLRQCLLTDIKLFKMVDRALTACHVFTSYMATCAKHIDSTDTALNINLSLKQRSAKMKESASNVRAVVESAKYQASITQLRDKFCKYTDELVSALASLPTTTYDSHMSLLAERLRFDGA